MTRLDILFFGLTPTGLTLECFFSGKREEGNAGTVNRHHIQETLSNKIGNNWSDFDFHGLSLLTSLWNQSSNDTNFKGFGFMLCFLHLQYNLAFGCIFWRLVIKWKEDFTQMTKSFNWSQIFVTNIFHLLNKLNLH